jgi:hypothetical protein
MESKGILQDKAKKLKITLELLSLSLAGIAQGKSDIQVLKQYLKEYSVKKFSGNSAIADQKILDIIKKHKDGFHSADNYFDFSKPVTNSQAMSYGYIMAETEKLFTPPNVKRYGFGSFLAIIKDKCKNELKDLTPQQSPQWDDRMINE